MNLKNIVENKFTLLSSAALILVPYYTWKNLYSSYKSLKNRYDEELLYHKRHNCVVMYNELKGMSGWPPHTERIRLDFKKENCLDVFREPVIYFIDTAKKSLDIAFMLINTNSIYKALIKAHKKGIRVRLLLNFEHCERVLKELRDLIKEGIEVSTYVTQGMASIMHYKYIVKDYTETSGFICTGSLNLTDSGFISNYEDVVFTSNYYTVSAYHKNFEECWDFIKLDNEDIINKTTLLDVNLL